MSASVKTQRENLAPRISACRRTARVKLQRRKCDARMSQPVRSAPLKSQSTKSFQHIRDSLRSLLTKPTRSNDDLPKNIRGSVRLLKSASDRSSRKNEKASGSGSS